MRLAKCKFIRPHVLRHTGIDRLINKFNLPVSIVQAVSHHADSDTLLNIYARRNRTDAFKDINQLFPIEPENAAKYEAPLLAISTKLNELSADIGRQSQQKHIFSRADVEEMLESLGDQIARLTKCLGFDTLSNEVLITKEEYLLIDAKLRSLGLSYQKVLGFEPTVQQQTLIKATKRTRKSLLGS